MTKTIKRSLIAIMMLVFAVSTVFTAAYAVKADETQDPAAVAAESFASIVATWEDVDVENVDILFDIDADTDGAQWLIDSAAHARELYADGKAVIDADYAEEKAIYDAVIAACKDALDFKAQINELHGKLAKEAEGKIAIFGSEKLYVNNLANTYANVLDDSELEYIDSKFVNETVEEIIEDAQARIADIYADGEDAAVAIANIVTFDIEGEQVALLASEETLSAAIDALKEIYGVAIEEIFAMNVSVDGDIYAENADKVGLYVENIDTYVELKAQYDAQVALAQEVIDAIDLLVKKIDADMLDDSIAYKYLANYEAVLEVEEAFSELDDSDDNDLQGYVMERSGDLIKNIVAGIYNDQIQEAVDMVLALPAADEAGIIPLKDALDAYRAKFNALTDEQKAAVNATVIAEDSEYAEYETIKKLYDHYNEKSTEPWALVQYAITAIDAIILDEDGVFVMSVEAVASLVNAQKKYANVPEDYKKYVTNRDVLFAAEAKMDEDMETVRVWAEMVYAIYENAPISVTNMDAVQEAFDYFFGDAEAEEYNIIPEIQAYIFDVPAFRAFTLTDVEGVEEDKAIQYYYDLFISEIMSCFFLQIELDMTAERMDIAAVAIINADEDECTYVEIADLLAELSVAKASFNENFVLSEEDWDICVELFFALDPETIPYIPFSYGQAEREYLAAEYGAIVKGWYDEADEADKDIYNYYNFYANYLDAIEIAKRYEVEIEIEALTAAEDVTILDEDAIIDTLKMFYGLVEENEDVACGQDSVRNAEKLFACKEALDDITDKLDAFIAAVEDLFQETIVGTAINLDLVAYAEAQEIRASLTDDEAADIGYGPRYGQDVAKAIYNLDVIRKATIKNINDLTDALYAVSGNGEEFVELYNAYMALDASQRDMDNEIILAAAIPTVAETASIVELREAYRFAGTVANTDWINSVDNRLDDVKAELEEAIAALDDKAATKEALQAAIDAINAAIAEEVEALEGALADLDEEFADALAEEVEALEGKIASLKTELEGKVSALESKLQAAINKEIADREAADAALQEQIDSTRTLAIVGLVIAIVGLCAAAFVIVYKVILKK